MAHQSLRNDDEMADPPAPATSEESATHHNVSEDAAADVVDASQERRSTRPRTTPSGKPPQVTQEVCHACKCSEPSMVLRNCSTCHVSVHSRCYAVPASEMEETPAEWTCDSCREGESSDVRVCVFCRLDGDQCMRRVDLSHWPTTYRATVMTSPGWAHAMCALWDPFQTSPSVSSVDNSAAMDEPEKEAESTESEAPAEQPKKTDTVAASGSVHPLRARLELLVPACAFCSNESGVRVQCRRLNCGRFFHVRCAHLADRSHIEVVHRPFPLKHAYCDRHAQSRHDVRDLVTKLTSKTMASLVPREVATKIQGIARRIESYASVDAVFIDLVSVLEDMCRKGLKNSKSDPPSFSMRQLQALQLVLDHLPQLNNTCDASTLSKTEADLVQDAEVVHALHKAFHPQRFVRKFAGPFSQFHQCDACHEPFQERQHVFYCTSTDQIHALHWRCTKRKSAGKDSRQGGSGSAKKKAKSVSLVQQGHWTDVKLPKGIPSIGDGVACGVCRSSVDAKAIIAVKKEATRMEFEKPTSDFMFGGCFVNEMDPRTAAAAGLRTSRATVATTAQTGVSSASSSTRMSGKNAVKRSVSGASTILDIDGEASTVIAPPKMDRINVQRTTRWLACLGQVIRLVMAARKEERLQQENEARKNESSTRATDAAEQPATGEPAPASDQVEHIKHSEGETKSVHSNAQSSVDVEMKEASSEHSEGTASSVDSNKLSSVDVERKDASTGGSTQAAVVQQELELPEPPTEEAVLPSAQLTESTGGESAVMAVEAPVEASTTSSPPTLASAIPASALAHLEEAKNIVRPFDAYALSKMESAHRMFDERKGPALSVLSTLIQEYTRFLYVKHMRAVAKATNEKRKREELEAQEERERERKRIDREAELALKKQMSAMRKKQRT